MSFASWETIEQLFDALRCTLTFRCIKLCVVSCCYLGYFRSIFLKYIRAGYGVRYSPKATVSSSGGLLCSFFFPLMFSVHFIHMSSEHMATNFQNQLRVKPLRRGQLNISVERCAFYQAWQGGFDPWDQHSRPEPTFSGCSSPFTPVLWCICPTTNKQIKNLESIKGWSFATNFGLIKFKVSIKNKIKLSWFEWEMSLLSSGNKTFGFLCLCTHWRRKS